MSTVSGSATLKGSGSPRISPAKLMKPLTDKASQPGPMKSSRTTLEAHGDGTYSTTSGYGEPVQHPSIGHALMHMAMLHSQGTHVHIHQNSPLTTHHVKDGEMTGPHSHKNLEALKASLGKFIDEEEKEKD